MSRHKPYNFWFCQQWKCSVAKSKGLFSGFSCFISLCSSLASTYFLKCSHSWCPGHPLVKVIRSPYTLLGLLENHSFFMVIRGLLLKGDTVVLLFFLLYVHFPSDVIHLITWSAFSLVHNFLTYNSRSDLSSELQKSISLIYYAVPKHPQDLNLKQWSFISLMNPKAKTPN